MKYKIGTIAQKTGFSPNLLRTWELRYGFLRPSRGPGNQRLFGDEDFLLLSYIKEQLEAGLSIGELANQGREKLLRNARPQPTDWQPALQSHGPGLPDTSIEKLIISVIDAAVGVDSLALDRALQYAFARLTPSDVLKKIMKPALSELGEGWKQGRISIAAEHLASNTFSQKIKTLIETNQGSNQRQPNPPKALCACFPGEEHSLGLLNAAYILATQGFQIVFLGKNLPFTDLDRAISQTNPSSVWLSVTGQALYHRYLLDLILLVKKYQPLPFVLGGQALTYSNPALENIGCMQCLQPFELPEDLLKLPFV